MNQVNKANEVLKELIELELKIVEEQLEENKDILQSIQDNLQDIDDISYNDKINLDYRDLYIEANNIQTLLYVINKLEEILKNDYLEYEIDSGIDMYKETINDMENGLRRELKREMNNFKLELFRETGNHKKGQYYTNIQTLTILSKIKNDYEKLMENKTYGKTN